MSEQMDGLLGGIYEKFSSEFYLIFRVLIGLLFTLHGFQKIFGLFTDSGAMEFGSLFFFAGLIELVGGILIILGIITRLVASIGFLEMVVAYLKVHLPFLVVPIQPGGGEVVILFIAGFIVLAVYGSGKWGLERVLTKKEVF